MQRTTRMESMSRMQVFVLSCVLSQHQIRDTKGLVGILDHPYTGHPPQPITASKSRLIWMWAGQFRVKSVTKGPLRSACIVNQVPASPEASRHKIKQFRDILTRAEELTEIAESIILIQLVTNHVEQG